MRAVPFACLLIGTSAAYFVVRATTSLGNVPPLPPAAAFLGVMGAALLVTSACARVSRRLNRFPEPPFFTMDKTHGRCLEPDADGSYESCEQLLTTLAEEFGAVYSKHLDAGPCPGSDKDKGYWNVTMFGQNFFVMRDRGHGISLWGPDTPEDPTGFLRVAARFQAVEHITWQQKIAMLLTRKRPRVPTQVR